MLHGCQGIRPSKTRQATTSAGGKSQDQGVDERYDIDFALSLHDAQVTTATANQLGGN
jgi:hypothetical protein